VPIFSPPTVADIPRVLPETRGVAYRLMRHYSPTVRGRSVLRTAGVYRTLDNPSQTDIDAASEVYLGGHIYTVTQTVADALTIAGYTVGADLGVPSRAITWGALTGGSWDDFVDNYGSWG
jgi:hypothetical protein